MKLPSEPRPNEPIRRSWGVDVVRYLRALTPRPSKDVQPSIGPGGTTFAIRTRSRRVKAVEEIDHPWKTTWDGTHVTVGDGVLQLIGRNVRIPWTQGEIELSAANDQSVCLIHEYGTETLSVAVHDSAGLPDDNASQFVIIVAEISSDIVLQRICSDLMIYEPDVC